MPHITPTADSVHDMAEQLINHALRAGLIVTIERRSLQPFAMGHAEYVIETRPARSSMHQAAQPSSPVFYGFDPATAGSDKSVTVSELQLACDFCSALVPDPWHGSTLEKKHIHACEKCLHLLPGHGIAPHGLQLVPTTTNPFIAAACDQSSQVCALESPTPVSIFADVDECMVVLRPPFNSVIKMPELAGWNRWSLKEKAEAIRQITMSRDVDDIEIDTAGIGIGLYQRYVNFSLALNSASESLPSPATSPPYKCLKRSCSGASGKTASRRLLPKKSPQPSRQIL